MNIAFDCNQKDSYIFSVIDGITYKYANPNQVYYSESNNDDVTNENEIPNVPDLQYYDGQDHYYIHNNNSTHTIIAVGGTGGGLSGPSYVYEFIAQNVIKLNISLLIVDVSVPKHDKTVIQIVNSLKTLELFNNQNPLLLIGWSMGGASMLNFSLHLKKIKRNCTGIILLASQTYGASCISQINVPVYIIHGGNDKCIDVSAADYLYKNANGHKMLYILKNSSHNFHEDEEDFRTIIIDIIKDNIS